MDGITVLHILLTVATAALGILVYLTNRKRTTNVVFLLLSFVLVAWLIFLGIGFQTKNLLIAAWAIKAANACGGFLPFASEALRMSIIHKIPHRRLILKHSYVWFALAVINAALCFTPFFVRDVVISGETAGCAGIPEPVYGIGIVIYALHQVILLCVFMARTAKGLKQEKGIVKCELQFVMLACGVGLLPGTINAVLLPIIFNTSQVVRFVPVAVLPFLAIIAYGIATRRIMDVGSVLRRITAYGLLLVYLTLLYSFVLIISHWLFGETGTVPHFLAALVMAFSLTPAHGKIHHVADRLFVHMPATDVGHTVQMAHEVLQTIGTLDSLLERFSSVVKESVGVGDVIILLERKGNFRQVYPQSLDAAESAIEFDYNAATLQILSQSQQPIIVEILHRRQVTPLLRDAAEELEQRKIAAAIGIRSKRGLQGVLLLGPRLSGKVYGALEQRALQMIANQLAVSIENARLYTQLQDGKLYNEILLDSLVSGVIATDNNNNITVFNREAGRITGLSPHDLIGETVDALPNALRHVVMTTLSTGRGIRYRESSVITHGGDALPIQIGSSVFHGHEGAVSGVLLVVDDFSVVKKLQTQVRRTAHLASVGTLAAGMAHEIKNPLVTLKTFSQLLGEQYEDPEFRETFSVLVGKEVNRIDRIVNELLRFGKPAKSEMTKISLRDVVEQSLQLVQVPLKKKSISLIVHWHVHTGATVGDPKLLEQAFVNFFLNAIDAMAERGDLTVELRLEKVPLPCGDNREDILPDRHLSVSIKDSGVGIKKSDLAQVFDPFFTTKSTGTGLGLSVAHSIIQEHGGMIDVESEYGVGTTLYVLFPVVRSGASSNGPVADDQVSMKGASK